MERSEAAMIIPRLIRFFQRSTECWPDELSPTWQTIVSQYHGPLAAALAAGNELAVESILTNPGPHLHGIEEASPVVWELQVTQGLLANLARRIGVLPLFNPEQPSPTSNWQPRDFNALRSDVEKVVGRLAVPSGFVFEGNPPGYPIHQLFRASEWFTVERFLGHAPRRVLEIGAGTGGFCLLAYQHGVEQYAIIDLPTTAVISAFYLARACGDDRIRLWGEEERRGVFATWFPCRQATAAKAEYDLIVNLNALPEMTTSVQDEYLKLIAQWLAPGGYFYSNNHESDFAGQGRVRDAVARNTTLELAYRAPFLMRPGYVEELYRKK